MPNIGNVLREEISRLALRTSRGQINPTKKSTAQHRRDIALLKRQVAQLERQVTVLLRPPAAAAALPRNGKACPLCREGTARTTQTSRTFCSRFWKARRRERPVDLQLGAGIWRAPARSRLQNWSHFAPSASGKFGRE